jgi:hypothetical protein
VLLLLLLLSLDGDADWEEAAAEEAEEKEEEEEEEEEGLIIQVKSARDPSADSAYSRYGKQDQVSGLAVHALDTRVRWVGKV